MGLGAAILPKEIYRINMQYASRIEGGHMGARQVHAETRFPLRSSLTLCRKFQRLILPRLKYYNPAVSMNVDKSVPQDSSPTLTVFLHSSASRSAEPSPADQTDPNAIVKSIDMKNRTDEDIWQDFVKATGAQEVPATEEDTAMLAKLAEQQAQSDTDSARRKEVNRRLKREADLLKQAKIDAAVVD